MKKSLLALAVLGSVAGLAQAQSNVTIYGIADAGIVFERGGKAGNLTKLTSGIESGSRIGFKGTEALSGGMSAIFQMEAGISIDDGRSTQGGVLFGRQAYVGLKGDFGKVTLGRQYSEHFVVLAIADPFDMGLAGSAGNIVIDYNPRLNNTLQWSSNDMGGLSGGLAYSFGEVNGSNSADRTFGANLHYNNGPLWLGFAHQLQNDAKSVSARRTAFAGTYNHDGVKLFGSLNLERGSLNINDMLIGVSVPLGPNSPTKFLASYINRNDKSRANQDTNQIGVGLLHDLSKRTALYTTYGHINNKNGAPYTVGSAIEAGSGNRAFNFGMRHAF